jgi:exodeoxyribonuclease VII small subunit
MAEKDTIQEQLKKLEEIAAWFEKSDEFDVEEGLKKVKEGAELVKKLKGRIKEVENEFHEIEADLKDTE